MTILGAAKQILRTQGALPAGVQGISTVSHVDKLGVKVEKTG